jgi:hypothetical protein
LFYQNKYIGGKMNKKTLSEVLVAAATTILTFDIGLGVAYIKSNADTPSYNGYDNRLEAKVYSVIDNGKSFLGGRDIEFLATDANGDTVKIVRGEIEAKRVNDQVLQDYVNSLKDTSNRRIIFFGKYENELKKLEYSVQPNGAIVQTRTFNADYAMTKDGSLLPLMK